MRHSMRRCLICGGVDGSDEALKLLSRAVEDRQPDSVLFVGGVLAPGGQQSTPAGRRDLAPQEAQSYRRFFETLGRMDTLTAFIPGEYDVPLREFLRLATGAEIENPKLRAVHATLATGGDFAVCGVGGRLTESTDSGEHRVQLSRGTAEYSLRVLWRAEQSRKILLLSLPPSGPMGGSGEAGAIAGELIDSYHPSLCAAGGKTENRGVARIGNTTVVSPGRLSDGSAAWFDWTQAKDAQVEMLDLAGARVGG
jgi:Icc-related predicted phosphoesterase